MRRRMKTHPRSRACFGARNTRARRQIRSRDRHVPRRRPRDARSRTRRFSNAQYVDLGEIREIRAARKKKKRRSATTEKIFSIARSDLERGGFARSTTRGSRAIDDRRRQGRAIARSIDRARARPTARARPFGTRAWARGRRRRARRAGERERGRERAGGGSVRKNSRAATSRRGRGDAVGDGARAVAIHPSIAPSSHPAI